MKTRPKSLDLLALFLMLVALSFPLQVMFLYGHTVQEIYSVGAKIAPLNWVTMVLCLSTSALLYRASFTALLIIPFLLIIVAWNNWIVASAGTDFSQLNAALATFGFFFAHTLLFHEPALQILQNPQLRWWMTHPRRKLEMPIHINPFRGNAFKTTTFDVSDTGAFISLDKLPSNMRVGDLLNVRMKVGALSEVRCDAQITRVTNHTGTHPAGVGIQFFEIDRQSRRNLSHCLSH